MKEIKDYSLLPHNTFGMDVKASLFVEYTKASLTGNGNTTELYFTYIHTYQSYNVTGSISASGAGISISNVANQWPLSVRLYGIPY